MTGKDTPLASSSSAMTLKENDPRSADVDNDTAASVASNDKNNNKVPAIPDEKIQEKPASVPKNKDDEKSSSVPSSHEAEEVASSFHYFVFGLLYMNGFLCHCRKYFNDERLIVMGHLVCYVLVESLSSSRRYSNFVFLSFLVFCIYATIEGLPHNANHQNFIGYTSMLLLPSQARRALMGPNVRETISALNVVRCAVVILYFMAGFHKINTDFLFHHEDSCAYHILWAYFSEVLGLKDEDLEEHRLPPWLKPLPFVGLFVELIPPLLLLFGPTQKWGVLMLIMLHLLLLPVGFSDFGSIAQSYLWLFVAPQAAMKAQPLQYYKDMAIFFAAFQLIVYVLWKADEDEEGEEISAPYRDAEVAMVFIAYGMIWASVFRVPTSFPGAKFTRPKSVFSCLALVWFILFAFSPYFGLRTTGTLTMFSNLRTEGPVSNHLLLRSNPLKLFKYQEDLVEVLEVDPQLASDWEAGVLYQKLVFDRFVQDEEREKLSMTVRYQEIDYRTEDLVSDPAFDIFRKEESWWHYKAFAFRDVQREGPQECMW